MPHSVMHWKHSLSATYWKIALSRNPHLSIITVPISCLRYVLQSFLSWWHMLTFTKLLPHTFTRYSKTEDCNPITYLDSRRLYA